MNPLYQITNDDPRVQAAIAKIQQLASTRGETLSVSQHSEESWGITFRGWTSYTTTFSRQGAPDYTAVSGLLAFYPSISITEMEATGLLPKAA